MNELSKKYNWRVAHTQTIDESANVLTIEQWGPTGLGMAQSSVYIPVETLDRFVERVQTKSAQIKRAEQWRVHPDKVFVTEPRDPRYRTVWTIIVGTLKELGMVFEVRGEMADALVEALTKYMPPLLEPDSTERED
ncbi:MAG: hypothetical protein ACYTBJ_00295 [Planctomycetota bacterium]|jgi:hypothetical protein